MNEPEILESAVSISVRQEPLILIAVTYRSHDYKTLGESAIMWFVEKAQLAIHKNKIVHFKNYPEFLGTPNMIGPFC